MANCQCYVTENRSGLARLTGVGRKQRLAKASNRLAIGN
jgi:hypothetical protein